jgi:peptidoglycan/LPS O-acetylase OafA/YrhL
LNWRSVINNIQNYRPEIDGLRTIAVLSVILYHAQIVVFGHDFFKGGFVGVDIFFVISGYLISRILLSELFEKGKISFLQFYERRARRILPILFTVFIVSFPLAYKYLLPNQFIEYAQSILSATFFGSNIFFYFTNTQYGAEDSLLQPSLHTWSLGVEEQFYILFPIVLLLAYRFAKNHLVSIIAVLILISLFYADWQSTKNTQLNFFMLTSRLWELGIGSLLAFYELKYGRVKHELLNQTMPLFGFAMIMYAIVFFNNQTPHPSFITLLPTLGTALIILYSVNTTDLVSKVLSWKPIVGVGLISYSLYLWHYPIFAFARIADTNGLHNDEKYLLILLTIVLSVISYFVIEKSFRNRQFLNIKKFSVAILLLIIAVLGMNCKIIWGKGFIDRYHNTIAEKMINVEWVKLRNPSYLPQNQNITSKIDDKLFKDSICYKRRIAKDGCIFGSVEFITLGDSFVGSLEPTLLNELHKHKIGLQTNQYPQCVYLSQRYSRSDNENHPCLEVNHERDKYYKTLDKSKIFIVFHASASIDNLESKNKLLNNQDSKWSDHFNQLEILLSLGHKIIFVYGQPKPKINSRKLINELKILNYIGPSLYGAENKMLVEKKFLYLQKHLDKISKNANFATVKIYDIFCKSSGQKMCFDLIENIGPLYNNGEHLSHYGAQLVVDAILKKAHELEFYTR